MCKSIDIYRRLEEIKSDDHLGETLGLNTDHLIDLFAKSFGPKFLDNYEKAFACNFYCWAFPVWNKLSSHGTAVTPICPCYGQDRKTALHAFMECSELVDLLNYTEPILSPIKGVQQSHLRGESLACFSSVIALLKGRL